MIRLRFRIYFAALPHNSDIDYGILLSYVFVVPLEAKKPQIATTKKVQPNKWGFKTHCSKENYNV